MLPVFVGSLVRLSAADIYGLLLLCLWLDQQVSLLVVDTPFRKRFPRRMAICELSVCVLAAEGIVSAYRFMIMVCCDIFPDLIACFCEFWSESQYYGCFCCAGKEGDQTLHLHGPFRFSNGYSDHGWALCYLVTIFYGLLS
ncbi:hypothetical protein ACHQM5_021277 [Ranunculus cassubicifolius]